MVLLKGLKQDEEINGYITKMVNEKYPTNNLLENKSMLMIAK